MKHASDCELGDDDDKRDGGAWRAETQGTTGGGDAVDMIRHAVDGRDDWENKKDADGC